LACQTLSRGCVNALSFGYRVAQFSNPHELRFASLKVSVVVFLPRA
jgi:hypothetical protein